MAQSTSRAYATGVRAYTQYAALRQFPAFPVQPSKLLDFLAYSSSRHQSATGKVCLQGIRHHCVVNGLPITAFEDPRINLLLQGIARTQATSGHRPTRNPGTQEHLLLVANFLPHAGLTPPDQKMLWSALTLAYFGFLRVSEYTSTVSARTLTPSRVAVHDNLIKLTIPFAKTAQLGGGDDVIVGATGGRTCPLIAYREYLAVRPKLDGPLYLFQTGQPLQPWDVNDLLHRALPGLNITSHSLRIGAATAAGEKGLPDYVIRRAGRWRSNAYLRYVRLSEPDLQPVAGTLASRV